MLIELENVCIKRGDSFELHIEKLAASKGERLAITGQSGCGKSTTLDIIGMTLEPACADRFIFSPGSENFDVADTWRRHDEGALTELRRRHIGYILQTGEIFGFINVHENIELTAIVAGMDGHLARQRAEELMAKLSIGHLARQLPATLSIGQRQRVAIARAIAPAPELILADEPTSALDPELAVEVMELMLNAVRDDGATLIMVTHDLGLLDKFDFRRAPMRVDGRKAILEAS